MIIVSLVRIMRGLGAHNVIHNSTKRYNTFNFEFRKLLKFLFRHILRFFVFRQIINFLLQILALLKQLLCPFRVAANDCQVGMSFSELVSHVLNLCIFVHEKRDLKGDSSCGEELCKSFLAYWHIYKALGDKDTNDNSVLFT